MFRNRRRTATLHCGMSTHLFPSLSGAKTTQQLLQGASVGHYPKLKAPTPLSRGRREISIHSTLASQTAPFPQDFHQSRQHKYNTKLYFQLCSERGRFSRCGAPHQAANEVLGLQVIFDWHLLSKQTYKQLHRYALTISRALPAVLQLIKFVNTTLFS